MKLIAFFSTIVILLIGFSYLFIDPNFFYYKNVFNGIAFSHRAFVSAFYALLIIGFFLAYVCILHEVKKKRLGIRKISILLAISFLIILSYPTVLSYDIFNYLATAKVTFFHFENPYLVMPNEFIDDPMLLYTRATNKLALYGPTWIALTSIPYYLSFESVIAQTFLFKILVGVFYVGLVYLLYRISRDLFIVSVFAFNPLVLFEVFMSGHNDVVMMFFVFLGFYLFQKNKYILSGFSFFVSIFVKFASLFLLPIWIYLFYKKSAKKSITWSKVWLFSLVCMGIIFILSSLREEIYPWYFVWLLPFVALINKKQISILSAAISFGLLAYYIPYMYTGHYIFFAKLICVACFSAGFLLAYVIFNKITKSWVF